MLEYARTESCLKEHGTNLFLLELPEIVRARSTFQKRRLPEDLFYGRTTTPRLSSWLAVAETLRYWVKGRLFMVREGQEAYKVKTMECAVRAQPTCAGCPPPLGVLLRARIS